MRTHFDLPIHILVIVWISSAVAADIQDLSPISQNAIWSADSLYLGAGLLVRDCAESVIVSFDTTRSQELGQLYFVNPHSDSLVLLFHNQRLEFPQEKIRVSLGSFPEGTPIVFMYLLVDTSTYARSTGKWMKKLYTGQNRPNVDRFVSESPGAFGARWAVAGRIDSTTCEVGFGGATTGYGYTDVIFSVTSVMVEGVEKHKLAIPRPEPPPQLNVPTNVSLSVPAEGLRTILAGPSAAVADTIDPVKNGATLRIYYTTDGSGPDTNSTLYTSPIPLSQTTMIKTFAYLQGDTNWFPSEVATYTYAFDLTRAARLAGSPFSGLGSHGSLTFFNIRGQAIVNDRDRISGRPGVYLAGFTRQTRSHGLSKVLVLK